MDPKVYFHDYSWLLLVQTVWGLTQNKLTTYYMNIDFYISKMKIIIWKNISYDEKWCFSFNIPFSQILVMWLSLRCSLLCGACSSPHMPHHYRNKIILTFPNWCKWDKQNSLNTITGLWHPTCEESRCEENSLFSSFIFPTTSCVLPLKLGHAFLSFFLLSLFLMIFYFSI